MFQTVYDFELPMGYKDEKGFFHKHGKMRLATAGDEILPLKDPRCQANEAYLIIILLSRVVTELGDVCVTPKVIEDLYRADLAYLQALYNQVNRVGQAAVAAKCPRCEHAFEVGLDDSGG